jgi:hypothetical protein
VASFFAIAADAIIGKNGQNISGLTLILCLLPDPMDKKRVDPCDQRGVMLSTAQAAVSFP